MDYTQDREDALTCVKNAAKTLTYFGLADFSEGWSPKSIGRQTNEQNVSVEEMTSTELIKVYNELAGLRDCVNDLLGGIHFLATMTALCEHQKKEGE